MSDLRLGHTFWLGRPAHMYVSILDSEKSGNYSYFVNVTSTKSISTVEGRCVVMISKEEHRIHGHIAFDMGLLFDPAETQVLLKKVRQKKISTDEDMPLKTVQRIIEGDRKS